MIVRTLAVAIVTATSLAQDGPLAVDPTPIATDAPPAAVTVYLGRAAVTRRLARIFEPGVYAVTFTGLPAAARRGSLQARVEAPGRVIGVDEGSVRPAEPPPTQAGALDTEIAQLDRAIEHLVEDRAALDADAALVEAVGVRTASDATAAGGTSRLDLDVVRTQLQFVRDERARLIDARRALDASERELQAQREALRARRDAIVTGPETLRTAVVTVAVTARAELAVELTYLVDDATWQPAYNVRATLGESTVEVEYDALLTQQTGEDWRDVALTLSTAQPTTAANPPALDPWYVDIRRNAADGLASGDAYKRAPAAATPPARGAVTFASPSMRAEKLSADAEVAGSGPAVSFPLPRRITVASDAAASQRTRIAGFSAAADFVHVAVPTHTEAVYVRGELANDSPYHLLPGAAAIFLGHDYIGPTTLEAVAPGGEFDVHFGVDRDVRVTRTLVQKTTTRTGLLNGGLRTSADYRIEIDNASGTTVRLELWDRIPVSRSDQIKIELAGPSVPLAADADYVETERPQGLLKWLIGVAPTSRDANALVLTYGIRVNRSKDVRMTGLPD